jgi:hypothetical protein
MSFITTAVKDRLLAERAEIFFVSGAATKWWNKQRRDPKTEVALLGGWYWTLKGEEMGPFRTPSAAWRDVYYRRLLEQDPPCMDKKDLQRVHREIKKEHAHSPQVPSGSARVNVVRLRA